MVWKHRHMRSHAMAWQEMTGMPSPPAHTVSFVWAWNTGINGEEKERSSHVTDIQSIAEQASTQATLHTYTRTASSSPVPPPWVKTVSSCLRRQSLSSSSCHRCVARQACEEDQDGRVRVRWGWGGKRWEDKPTAAMKAEEQLLRCWVLLLPHAMVLKMRCHIRQRAESWEREWEMSNECDEYTCCRHEI